MFFSKDEIEQLHMRSTHSLVHSVEKRQINPPQKNEQERNLMLGFWYDEKRRRFCDIKSSLCSHQSFSAATGGHRQQTGVFESASGRNVIGANKCK